MKQSVVNRKVVTVVDACEMVGIAVSDELDAIARKSESLVIKEVYLL